MPRKLRLTIIKGAAVCLSLTDEATGNVLAEGRVPPDGDLSAPSDTSEAGWLSWSERVVPQVLPTSILKCLLSHALVGPVQIAVTGDEGLTESIVWEGLCHRDFPHGKMSVGSLRWLRQGVAAPAPLERGVGEAVLVAWADPGSASYPPLANVAAEADRVAEAFRAKGYAVERLPAATRAGLLHTLSTKEYRWVHFSGHADVMPTGGALVLESGIPAEAELVYSDELARVLRAEVVVLAGCRTGSPGGVGPMLARAGTKAVIAFQGGVSEVSARYFVSGFYASLALGSNLLEAVHDARATLARCGGEWFAPVLFANQNCEETTLIRSSSPLLASSPRLPANDHPFFGRTAERSEIAERLRSLDCRVMTITGLGGMGKSRLALALAHELALEFSGGVHWIDCTEIRTEEELVATIASSLDPDGRSYSERRLSEILAGNRSLLVLDCFERTVEQAPLLARLVQTAPGFKILVTSRRLLGIPGEYEFPLGPLVAKGKAALRDATDLFQQSAQQACHGFRVSRTNRATIRKLVEALEAIPLAVVLAAGRLRTMDLDRLLERVIQQRHDVLRTTGQDRHARLAFVVQGSFELLTASEHALMAECSVFHGGFAWEDAEAVLNPCGDLLEGITSLRENSLLATGGPESGLRFRILDTVREYIESRLPADIPEAARRRHAEHFARRASLLRREWDEGKRAEANVGLWLDVANLRAAILYAIAHRDAGLIRNFAMSMARWYLETGLRGDIDRLVLVSEPIALAMADTEPGFIIELRGLQGECMRREQRASEATAFWLDRGARCEALGEYDMAADTYTDVASLGLTLDEPETVNAMLGRIDRLDSRRITPHIWAAALVIKARAALRWGDSEAAMDAAGEAEALIADHGREPRSLFIWMSLAIVHRTAGDLRHSETIARRLIREAVELWHVQSIARGLLELARTLEAKGDLDGAASALVAGEAIPRHASPQAKAETRRHRQEFAARHGLLQIEAAEKRAARRDWRAIASEHGDFDPEPLDLRLSAR